MRKLRDQAMTCWGAALGFAAAAAAAPEVGILLKGTDFSGGAQQQFGSAHFGEGQVNYVYARPTGAHASMKATFELAAVPPTPLFLHLKARDDDAGGACGIEMALNGKRIFSGKSPFPSDAWAVRKFPIPAEALKPGANVITIANTEAQGPLGNPPWFMVASCGIGGEALVIRRDVAQDFFVTLPKAKRPLPEPLPEGAQPGFKIRGTKGWNWTPEQYLSEIPVLQRYKLNFLMNCYLSMFAGDVPWNSGNANRWWEPLPEERRQAYAKVVRECQKAGIEFCFAVNPNLTSKRILRYHSAEDLDALWQNYAWMAGLGVNWFSVCLDDISEGIDAKGQAGAVNELYRRLKSKNPQAQMVFCPTIYWGNGDDPKEAAYLDALGETLDAEIYCFWTGDAVVGRISRAAAEKYRSHLKHRLIVWDNYPVNDSAQTLHLGPVTGRDADLCEVASGYMSNPLCPQNEINRIPLLTIADYTFNPAAYDPSRSIGQAIFHLSDNEAQREALKDLVEAYPGMLMYKSGTGFNAVRHQYNRLVSAPHSRYLAADYIQRMENLLERLGRLFPNRYTDARRTLELDVKWMKSSFASKYGDDSPPEGGR